MYSGNVIPLFQLFLKSITHSYLPFASNDLYFTKLIYWIDFNLALAICIRYICSMTLRELRLSDKVCDFLFLLTAVGVSSKITIVT